MFGPLIPAQQLQNMVRIALLNGLTKTPIDPLPYQVCMQNNPMPSVTPPTIPNYPNIWKV